MASYSIATTLQMDYDSAVDAARAALADVGFGVLTEIDVKATMKAKLDIDVPAQIILGACRPPLAHRAMSAEPSIATLLPCNVVVRELGSAVTIVEMIDPGVMSQLATAPEMAEVAEEARALLVAALDALGGTRSDRAA